MNENCNKHTVSLLYKNGANSENIDSLIYVQMLVCFHILLLGAVDEQPLAESLLELLLARLTSATTKDKLTPELPLERDAPVLSSLLVDDGVVVLQVGAEALSLERNPQRVLVHGIGVLAPVAKVVGVQGEGLA